MLKSGLSKDLPDKLNELEQEITLVFSEIDGLDIDNIVTNETVSPIKRDLASQLTDLNALLADYDASAVKYIEQLRIPLLENGFDDDFNKIKDCLSHYDFDQALDISRKIKT